MTMDNGSPWGYSGDQLHTSFSAWLIRLGIYVSHSRPKHPQTQGKLERFHRTLKLELLNTYSFENLDEAQKGFNWWQKIYNEERPHQAIGFNTPSKRYTRSKTPYPEKLPPIEYDSSLIIRKVQQNGIIHFKGKEFRVGAAFYGNHVGMKEAEEDGLMDVYFCQQKVLKININC
jgi:putative transposase